MAERIRIGIVGATVSPGGSGWGANAHVPALAVLPDYELKAVCTAHEETARASAEAFGAPLAFHDIEAMAAHPEVDLVAVSVRVPLHYELTMAAIRAGKPVFCEWPLGANLREAEEMAEAARERALPNFVGLQARSDPTIRYARELIAQGHIGEVLAANLSVISQAAIERPAGRLWQGVRTNGANVMTIQGGHAIDALCYILGEFVEVSGRVRTRIPEWRNTDTGEAVPVDSPDTIAASGRLENGAEIAIQIASVPSNPSGIRLEIYGSEGSLLLTSNSFNIGPNQLYSARGQEPLAKLTVPDSYMLAPEGTPPGQPRNVAQAYVRMADALSGREPFEPDFDAAVTRHRLLDAIERSSEEGRMVRLGG